MIEIELVFYVSPSCRKTKTSKYDYMEILAKNRNVPFIKHDGDTIFVNNKEYFYDAVHMNKGVATVYTNQIVSELKNIKKELLYENRVKNPILGY